MRRLRSSSPGGASKTMRLLCFFTLLLTSRLSAQQLNFVDKEALTEIHNDLQDLPGSTFFSSWDFSQDPCGLFSGVQCFTDSGESRVVMLNLGTPTGGASGLTGTLSPYVGNLSALIQLSLVPGEVEGPIPSTLGSLYNLEFLGLAQNRFTGKIPSSISNLGRLQSLILNGNYLSGNIPSGLGYLTSLSTLSIANNQFYGKIPDFSSSSPLQHLDVSNNQIGGKLPALPGGLNFLSVGSNQIGGNLGSIAGLNNLNYLDLSSNQLYGEIPFQVFSFPLQYLFLGKNGLTGTLALPSQSSIGVVDLGYNNLTGGVPSELGAVRNLYLNDNRFSGMVPPIFASNLQNAVIQTLHLQNNYLIGLSDLLAGMSLPQR